MQPDIRLSHVAAFLIMLVACAAFGWLMWGVP